MTTAKAGRPRASISCTPPTSRANKNIWVYELATGAKRKLTNQEWPKTNLTWAPNGTTMAYTANNHMYEIDVSKPGAVPREIAYNRAGGYSGISYSQDGKWLIYSRSNDSQISEVYLYEIADEARDQRHA